MQEEFLYLFNTFISLFVTIDPFAVVPVYLALTDRFSPEMQRRTRHRATFVAFAVLCTFALTGLSLFNAFGISMPAFQIAGGVLLFAFGLEQLGSFGLGPKDEDRQHASQGDISVFPLATPLLAGPGAISTVVLHASELQSTPMRYGSLLLAIVGALALSHLMFRIAPILNRWLGPTGLGLLTRLMGLIITAPGVQFLINGIGGAWTLLQKASAHAILP